MPEELDDLEKLLVDVRKVIRDNELFLRSLGDDALETECVEEPPDGGNSDEDGFEEL